MIDRRHFLAGAGTHIAASALAAPASVVLPPIPSMGFEAPRSRSLRFRWTARTRVTVSAGGETRLPCCHATDLVIEGVPPSAYALDPRRASSPPLRTSTPARPTRPRRTRYDAFGSKGYVAGTPRFVDPEEWGAAGELYRLYVSRFGVEVIPVHAYRDGVRLDRAGGASGLAVGVAEASGWRPAAA